MYDFIKTATGWKVFWGPPPKQESKGLDPRNVWPPFARHSAGVAVIPGRRPERVGVTPVPEEEAAVGS